MGRYNPPAPTFVLEPSLESLQMLTRGLQKDLDEAIYLTGLKTRLNALQSNTVTSAEQLVIKSSIATVVGRETLLSLSLEALRVAPNFNLTISQEGVGDMVKSAINAAVEKVKQFFAWVRGMIQKLFSGNKRKAEECKEAQQAISSAKASAEKAQEELRKSGKSMQDSVDEMSKSSDKLDETMNDFHAKSGSSKKSYTDEERRAQADEIRKMNEKDNEGKSSLQKLIKLARAGLISAKNPDEFIIRNSGSYPFRDAKQYNAFCDVINRLICQSIKDLDQIFRTTSDPAKMADGIENISEKFGNSREFSKYFQKDVDGSGMITFGVAKERDKGDVTYSKNEMDGVLGSSSAALMHLGDAVTNIPVAEKHLLKLLAEINRSVSDGGENSNSVKDEIASINQALKFLGILSRTVTDCNRMVTRVAEECIVVVKTLK